MSDTLERLSTPSFHVPLEEFREQALPVQPDYTAGLEPIEYPSFTLYLGEPSEAQRLRTGRLQHPEIKYVRSDNYAFQVDSFGLTHPEYLTRTQTMSLIWGALGKTKQTTAEELYVSTATIRTHRTVMLQKIGANTTTNAVRVAFGKKVFIPSPEKLHAALKLTPREFDVLEAISRNTGKERTGQELRIAHGTVKTHTQNILIANNLANCTQAVMMACLAGQLPLAETS